MEEETVRWMLPTGATILTVPKFDTHYRGISHYQDREMRKRDRRERMEEWRQIIRETRIAILNEDSARDQICSSFRGTIARDPNSITSYIDGTRHLRQEIERYNTSLKDRIMQLIAANGGMIPSAGMDIVETPAADVSMFDPPFPLPDLYASEDEVKAYNNAAIEYSKEIYVKYPFTRLVDVYDGIIAFN